MDSNNTANIERREVNRLFALAESKRDYPGSYFPAKHKAEAALDAWQQKYPAAAAAEREAEEQFRAEEKARREERFRTSFIGRGID